MVASSNDEDVCGQRSTELTPFDGLATASTTCMCSLIPDTCSFAFRCYLSVCAHAHAGECLLADLHSDILAGQLFPPATVT